MSIKVTKTFVIICLLIIFTLGSKVISDNSNAYISGPLYGDNSIFCQNYCVRGEKCIRNIGTKQIPTCTPVCGDGLLVAGKQSCDDGNNINGDGCSNCKIDPFYICSGEPSICKWSCGDNIYQPQIGQKCDNGNSTIQDGCSNSCQILDHWKCPKNNAGFSSICQYIPYCGDGIINSQNQKCDDGNNINFDGCSSNCSIVQTCITDLNNNKYCYWDCSRIFYQKFNISQLYINNNINNNKQYNMLDIKWCNDYNSQPNDGCTNCQIDQNYICIQIPNKYQYQNINITNVHQYQKYRESYCTNCVQNNIDIDNNFIKNQKCNITQPVCGDYIISQGEQCDSIFGCTDDCKLITTVFSKYNVDQLIQFYQNQLAQIQQTINDVNLTMEFVQQLLGIKYKLPLVNYRQNIKNITLLDIADFQQAHSYGQKTVNLIPLYSFYYPLSKQHNLGFHNFTMSQIKIFMQSNNCTFSQNPKMFDNNKLFVNLFICTLNFHTLHNKVAQIKYDSFVPNLTNFVQNVLNHTFQYIYNQMLFSQWYWINIDVDFQQYTREVIQKWLTQGNNKGHLIFTLVRYSMNFVLTINFMEPEDIQN